MPRAGLCCNRIWWLCWRDATDGRQASGGRTGHRPDQVRRQTSRRLDERTGARSHRQSAVRQRVDVGRHRCRRGRQGPRLLRGRHDAGTVHGRRPGRHRQAVDPGAHRRLGGRFHRRGGGQPGAVREIPAGARGGLGEAVGVQCHVGIVDSGAVHQTGRRRRGRLLRPAYPRLHPSLRGPVAHRCHGGGQGSAQWGQESLGPSASAGYHAGEGT